jgi:hypothetical protein
VRDQRFADSQLGKSEIGVVRTREVRVRERITVVDRRRDPDRSSGKRYQEIRNRGNRGKPTSKVVKCEILIRERGDQDRWITGECGPLIWRAKLASSGFEKKGDEQYSDNAKREVVKCSEYWPQVIVRGHIDKY